MIGSTLETQKPKLTLTAKRQNDPPVKALSMPIAKVGQRPKKLSAFAARLTHSASQNDAIALKRKHLLRETFLARRLKRRFEPVLPCLLAPCSRAQLPRQ